MMMIWAGAASAATPGCSIPQAWLLDLPLLNPPPPCCCPCPPAVTSLPSIRTLRRPPRIPVQKTTQVGTPPSPWGGIDSPSASSSSTPPPPPFLTLGHTHTRTRERARAVAQTLSRAGRIVVRRQHQQHTLGVEVPPQRPTGLLLGLIVVDRCFLQRWAPRSLRVASLSRSATSPRRQSSGASARDSHPTASRCRPPPCLPPLLPISSLPPLLLSTPISSHIPSLLYPSPPLPLTSPYFLGRGRG